MALSQLGSDFGFNARVTAWLVAQSELAYETALPTFPRAQGSEHTSQENKLAQDPTKNTTLSDLLGLAEKLGHKGPSAAREHSH
jgi:hypothetical protein